MPVLNRPVQPPSSGPTGPSPAAAPRPRTLFAYGFRPFFLLAGLLALGYGPWWVGSVVLGWPLASNWPPMLWHGHEMLNGLIVAAIAGFLLTAVPSWTGARGFAGRPLVLLVLVWLAGRIAILTPGLVSAPVAAMVDLAFLPLLGVFVAVPLLRARNRNTPLLGVLGLLWSSNVVFHWALLHHDAPLAGRSLLGGIDVVLVLVTVIGGRIVPAFTQGALKARGHALPPRHWPWLTPALVGAMLANVIASAVQPTGTAALIVAAVAAGLHAARLIQWRAPLVLMSPIVWILHLAYAWLPVGFALKAVALLTGAAFAAFWLHALTIGALTTMILAVMTRAALGHTGRSLVVATPITSAYVLITLAAIVRVFALGVLGWSYPHVLVLAALLWLAAFALYLYVYGPILIRPRADGRPG